VGHLAFDRAYETGRGSAGKGQTADAAERHATLRYRHVAIITSIAVEIVKAKMTAD